MSEQLKVSINSKSISSGIQYTPRAARIYTQVLPVGVETAAGIVQEESQLSQWIGQEFRSLQLLIYCLSQRLSRNTLSRPHQWSDKWVEASFLWGQALLCSLSAGTTHLRTLPAAKWCTTKSPQFPEEGTEGWPCNDMDIFCSGPCQELSNSFISCLCTKGSSIHWPEAWQGFRALT